ncbi:helix-turn-helix transcriptional regulator [Faecalicoccus pleomorphus]|uniref:helix-turn-helix transcriptional regulator n=1 Tax=Faecalicoccus pleomorphus TaxID=1323 RepID=UPI00242E1332|nr:helix-turn-helix transcriptional regulator [Faecalicoccus pleomorphus]
MRLDAKLLRGVLYDRDLTQNKLASISDLAQYTVNKVCNGGSCTYETGKKIADALGMKLEDLLEKR